MLHGVRIEPGSSVPLTTAAVGADGSVFIGSGGSSGLSCITPNGTLRWNNAGVGRVIGAPLLDAAGNLYAPVTTASGSVNTLVSLHSSSGALRWSYSSFGGALSSPSSTIDGHLVVASDSGYIAKLNSADGTTMWSFVAAKSPDTPTVDPDTGDMYIGAFGPQVCVVRAPTRL